MPSPLWRLPRAFDALLFYMNCRSSLSGSPASRLVDGESDGLGIGDLDQVADLDFVEVRRVLRLHRFYLALRTYQGDGAVGLIDGLYFRDQTDGTRPRAARLFAEIGPFGALDDRGLAHL